MHIELCEKLSVLLTPYTSSYVHALLVKQVPKTIPAWKAAFIEPLACSIHAVSRGDIQFEDVVVVSGCGPLGLGMVAAARMKNPKTLIALDLLDWKVVDVFQHTDTKSCRYSLTLLYVHAHINFIGLRITPVSHMKHTCIHTHTQLEIAKKCGADVVLNPTKCDVVEEVKKLSEDYGCDVYIEATGHPQSVRQGYVTD